jgi:4-hydroxythreonine-4-phosphate dehydrogenase
MAVVTLPIAKYRAQQGGMPFPGQTEFFEDIWQGEAVMLLAGPKLRVGLATNHHPLTSVSGLLTVEMLVGKMLTLARSLKLLLPATVNMVRLGVCGLNPHAGDHGLFGHEEERVIAPAIARAQEMLRGAAQISGPLPADTAFFHAAHGQYDAILAMYHDQGLGPLKLIHFSDAINVSLGLKHLRVAPDHGPAEDLYGTGRGDAASLSACFAVARRYLAENGS